MIARTSDFYQIAWSQPHSTKEKDEGRGQTFTSTLDTPDSRVMSFIAPFVREREGSLRRIAQRLPSVSKEVGKGEEGKRYHEVFVLIEDLRPDFLDVFLDGCVFCHEWLEGCFPSRALNNGDEYGRNKVGREVERGTYRSTITPFSFTAVFVTFRSQVASVKEPVDEMRTKYDYTR